MSTDTISNNILEALGNTPLIRLNRMTGPDSAQILVKYEGLNVGGSVKTRTAYNMILRAEQEGRLHPDSIIVEPTSGNQGIGLALIGAVRGYRTIIIMPDSVSIERSKLVKHYGAEVILIHDDGDIGKCIDDCRIKAEQLAAENSKVFIPQQVENPANVEAQYTQTAREILAQAGCKIDGFCSGIGTGGTITGIGRALKEDNPDILISSERTFRWASETASSPRSWTLRYTAISASSPTTKPSRLPRIWQGSKASCAVSRAVRTSLPPSSSQQSSDRARRS